MDSGLDKGELKELVKKATSKGAIHAFLYFDAFGNEKDAVEGSLTEYLGRIAKERGLIYCKGQIEESLESEEHRFTTYAEVEVLAESIDVLQRICMNYGPVGVEVMAPNSVTLELDELQRLLLNSANLSHEYASMVLRFQTSKENVDELERKFSARAEVGKKLLEKAKKK